MARKKSDQSESFGLDALRRAARKPAPRMGNAGPGVKPLPYQPRAGFRMPKGRGS